MPSMSNSRICESISLLYIPDNLAIKEVGPPLAEYLPAQLTDPPHRPQCRHDRIDIPAEFQHSVFIPELLVNPEGTAFIIISLIHTADCRAAEIPNKRGLSWNV